MLIRQVFLKKYIYISNGFNNTVTFKKDVWPSYIFYNKNVNISWIDLFLPKIYRYIKIVYFDVFLDTILWMQLKLFILIFAGWPLQWSLHKLWLWVIHLIISFSKPVLTINMMLLVTAVNYSQQQFWVWKKYWTNLQVILYCIYSWCVSCQFMFNPILIFDEFDIF